MLGPQHLVIGTVVAMLTLASCSSSDGAPAAAPSTVTVTATVTETVTASAAPTASPTPSASESARTECRTADLGAKIRALDSGAGQRYAAVVLTNTSSRTCTVTGYPGLQLVTPSGADAPTKVVRVASPAPRTVTLAADSKASARIAFGVIPAGSEPDTGDCEPDASTVRIIPPNATTSLTAAWSLGPVCSNGRIRANAFVAGNGG